MGYTKTVNGMRPCIACQCALPVAMFSEYKYKRSNGTVGMRYDSRCKPCNRQRRSERYADPECRAIDQATSRAWKHQHREWLKVYSALKRQDPEHRAIKAKSQRMRKARMRASAPTAKCPRISAIYEEARLWEQKLAACVASDDPLDLKVHVDHIVPLSRGGQHVAENLQVVSAYFNLTKGVLPHSAVAKELP